MSKLAKHVGLILLTQAVCLAVGLWMHHWLVVSSSINDARDAALVEMDAGIDRLVGALPVPSSEGRALDNGVRQTSWAETVLQQHPPTRDGLLVVDRQWRVLASGPLPVDSAVPFPVGAHVSWTPYPEAKGEQFRHTDGVMESSIGQLVAVAGRIAQHDGFVIAYRPRSVIERQATAALGSLPALSGLTFAWTCVLLGIPTYMILARFHEGAERERTRSIAQGLRQRQDLVRTRDAVVFGLAKLADSRDPDTGDHLERISIYSTALASVLRHHPTHGREVTPAFVRLIGISSVLHDIGKVGVEDRILLKPGRFTAQERVRMQSHTKIGGECLREIEQRLGTSNFLQMARQIALAHHERWDGTGYPEGLRGETIPLAARIVAIADVYDALSLRRVYKRAFAHHECVDAISAAAGSHFDPTLVEAWMAVEQKFGDIARRYGDAARTTPGREPMTAPEAREFVGASKEVEQLVSPASSGV